MKFIIYKVNLRKPIFFFRKPIITQNLRDDLLLRLSKRRCIFQNIMCHVISCLFLKYEKYRPWVQAHLGLKSDFLFTRNVTMRIVFKFPKPQLFLCFLCFEVLRGIRRSFLYLIITFKLFLCVALLRTRKREVTKKASFLALGACSLEGKVDIKHYNYKRKLQKGNKRLTRAIKGDLINYSGHRAIVSKEAFLKKRRFQMQSEKLMRVGQWTGSKEFLA